MKHAVLLIARFRAARLRLFAGAVLISLSPVWVKLVSVSPTASGFYRVLLGGAALAVFLAFSRRRFDLSRRVWGILVLTAVFLTLDLWLWHRSIQYLGPGLATLLANFQVFFMMFAGAFVLRQAPTRRQLVAVSLALVGLVTIVGIDPSKLTPDYRWGVLFGLLTAICYTGFLLSLRGARAHSQHRLPTREVALVSLITAALLGVTAAVEGESLLIANSMDLVWLAAYGVLSHCLGWLLIASSLPAVSLTEAGLALLLQPTLSFAWDILLFARPTSLAELVGVAITLLAIYLGTR